MSRYPYLPLVAALALAAATPAPAQTAAPAAAPPPASTAAPYVVKGFRSAQFGMTEAQVVSAAAKDFGVDPKSATRQVNAAQGTTVVTFTVARIEPVPVPAQVSYIFGASGHTLVHVNVVWATVAGQEDAQRPALIASALKLRGYFRGYGWPPKHMASDVPAGPNGVITFLGQDASGGAVEVMLQGVSYSREVGGKTVASPAPTGPAVLRVAYSQNAAKPDVAKVAPGSF
jgi:hypothetical protein